MKPRVLHLINNFDIGGTERQAVRLLQRLDGERYDLRLAALRNRGPFYAEIAARFPDVPEFPLTSFYNANAARQLARLRAWLLHERIDIVHAWDFYADLIGGAAARLAGVRMIASQRSLRISDRPIHTRGQRIIHRLAHRILVNSEAIRDHILALGSAPPEKIVVVRNGLHTPEDAPSVGANELCGVVTIAPHESGRTQARASLVRELGIEADARLIGAVAKLRPLKGHRFLLEAAARLVQGSEGMGNMHFILVGDGSLRGEIEAQVQQLGLGGRVHLLGDRLDVAQLIPAFDLAVLASTGGEGLPNALMEAMAAGVPVVATAISGIPELVADGETGYLVAPSDANALAQRIAQAFRDEARAAVAARGCEFVRARFGMPRMVEEVQQLYDELMTGGKKRT